MLFIQENLVLVFIVVSVLALLSYLISSRVNALDDFIEVTADTVKLMLGVTAILLLMHITIVDLGQKLDWRDIRFVVGAWALISGALGAMCGAFVNAVSSRSVLGFFANTFLGAVASGVVIAAANALVVLAYLLVLKY